MISIIVPVYNTSKWLSHCLDSCLAQSYRDIELIIVNDASPDDSLAICRKYAARDNRVRIVDKKVNEGVDRARFSGLDCAKGDFVTFVDSDDWLCDVNILEEMHREIEKHNADYVEMGIQRVIGNHIRIKRKSVSPVTGLITAPRLFDEYYISFFGVNILPVNMFGKLYRKSVIDAAALKPSGLVMGEDLAFNLSLFPHLKRIYILDKVGYSYRFGGMTSRYNPKLLPDLKELYRLKKRLIEQYDYNRAADYIRIELKNVFMSDVCQRIVYLGDSKEKVCESILEELSDSAYQDLGEVSGRPSFSESAIVKAILAKDASAIYDIAKEMVESKRMIHAAKRILSYILTRI